MAVMRTSRLLMALPPAAYFWFPPDIRTIVVPSTYQPQLEMHASLPYLIGAVLCGSTTTGVSEVDPGHEASDIIRIQEFNITKMVDGPCLPLEVVLIHINSLWMLWDM
ncbi:hypothetical protein B0H17DRAFT_1146774 [Mycena rosella]|uniref:Uncharacterized protein n=1 Tax=Mycena rosella TaxID=1033263 RepID=A0AAD7CN53_MYCRO|nr:hypothetical protein B0H17DRAFT_1146774 [Mycena rosella]